MTSHYFYWILLLLCGALLVASEPPLPPFCCPTNHTFSLEMKGCVIEKATNSDVTLAPMLLPHCENGGFLVDPSMPGEEEFTVDSGGDLVLAESKVSRDQYCLLSGIPKNRTLIGTMAYICFPENNSIVQGSHIQFILYPIALCISLPFLFATFIIYCLLPELRTTQGMSLMALVLSLAFAFFFLVIAQLATHSLSQGGCYFVALSCHFWFMAAFFWFSVVSFNTWYSFKFHPRPGMFRWLCLYGFGGPLIFSLTAIILDFGVDDDSGVIRPKFGVFKCWFDDHIGQITYMYGPLTILLIANLIFFILTVLELRKMSTATATKDRPIEQFQLYLKLFVVNGITWVFELISFFTEYAGHDYSFIWYVVDILNCLQGLIIFLILVAKKPIFNAVKKRLYSLSGRDELQLKSDIEQTIA